MSNIFIDKTDYILKYIKDPNSTVNAKEKYLNIRTTVQKAHTNHPHMKTELLKCIKKEIGKCNLCFHPFWSKG